MAAWFFALSLVPSLLPRSGMVQGVVSGVTVIIGYAFGAACQGIWNYLGIPKPLGRVRTVLIWLTVGLGLWAAIFTGWRMVGWQNEIRTLFGMESTSPTIWPTIIAITVVVAVLLLIIGRSLRLLFVTSGALARPGAAASGRTARRLGAAPGARRGRSSAACSSTASSPLPTTSSAPATP